VEETRESDTIMIIMSFYDGKIEKIPKDENEEKDFFFKYRNTHCNLKSTEKKEESQSLLIQCVYIYIYIYRSWQ